MRGEIKQIFPIAVSPSIVSGWYETELLTFLRF